MVGGTVAHGVVWKRGGHPKVLQLLLLLLSLALGNFLFKKLPAFLGGELVAVLDADFLLGGCGRRVIPGERDSRDAKSNSALHSGTWGMEHTVTSSGEPPLFQVTAFSR